MDMQADAGTGAGTAGRREPWRRLINLLAVIVLLSLGFAGREDPGPAVRPGVTAPMVAGPAAPHPHPGLHGVAAGGRGPGGRRAA